MNGDCGEAGVGFYSVTDGVLTMRDEKGKPTGKEYRLGPGDNEKVIASRLAKQAWSATRGNPILTGRCCISASALPRDCQTANKGDPFRNRHRPDETRNR